MDLTPVENHMIEAVSTTMTAGVGIVESAQEAGESSPVILHPLSPINETQNIVANNNSLEKVNFKKNIHYRFCFKCITVKQLGIERRLKSFK